MNDRWIVPIGLNGRIEIRARRDLKCDVAFYSSNDEDSKADGEFLTESELDTFRTTLDLARHRLGQFAAEQEAKKREANAAPTEETRYGLDDIPSEADPDRY